MNHFKNKLAIIVGGTSGIGKSTAEQLLASGAQVHIIGRNIGKVADQANLTKHQIDITNSSQLEGLVE